jgi:hypothetical protein
VGQSGKAWGFPFGYTIAGEWEKTGGGEGVDRSQDDGRVGFRNIFKVCDATIRPCEAVAGTDENALRCHGHP